jgi:tetratricopeptide (TPR) repeat protein
MRANVLNDPAFVKLAGQFAWLSIDSDQPVNQKFVDKFATGGVPLFVVIDAATGKPVLNWYGTATAPQLIQLMEDGKRAMAGGATGADALLARADAFNGEKKPEEAAKLYDQALEMGGKNWPQRTRAIESAVMADQFGRRIDACVKTAVREAPGMPRDRSFVNTVYFGLGCASPGSPELREMEKLAEEGVKVPGILGDDTSSLYQQLSGIYRRDKDEADATRVANDWLHYLQDQIAKAPTAESRMGYDLHLVSVAVFLHQPELALTEVERAERELPDDYNPPRLASTVYRQMHRYDDAVAAIDRALQKGYGVPKASLYYTKGQILEQKGDVEAAKQAYVEGITFARTLPEEAGKAIIARLEKAANPPPESRH